jgi:hypothetical protein
MDIPCLTPNEVRNYIDYQQLVSIRYCNIIKHILQFRIDNTQCQPYVHMIDKISFPLKFDHSIRPDNDYNEDCAYHMSLDERLSYLKENNWIQSDIKTTWIEDKLWFISSSNVEHNSRAALEICYALTLDPYVCAYIYCFGYPQPNYSRPSPEWLWRHVPKIPIYPSKPLGWDEVETGNRCYKMDILVYYLYYLCTYPHMPLITTECKTTVRIGWDEELYRLYPEYMVLKNPTEEPDHTWSYYKDVFDNHWYARKWKSSDWLPLKGHYQDDSQWPEADYGAEPMHMFHCHNLGSALIPIKMVQILNK